jgi:putative ABC transport system permease protein
MNLPRISFRMLVCDWRAGELNLLLFALVIAVGGIATVGFFVDRVQLTLSRQGNRLLGADLIIVSDHQISQHYTDEALRLGLVVSNALKFPSMVAKGENSLLTEIKAVATDYPLRGELRISDNISNVSSLRADYIPNAIPSSGSVWVDDKLANRLTLKQGDTIEVGATKLTVTALITQEPDHSIGFISLAPRLLINAVDLPAVSYTHLTLPTKLL